MTTPLLQLNSLAVGYGGEALCPPATASIAGGEVWAVVGRNGAGKSTLLRTALGLHRAVSGSAQVLAKRPSYVPQRARVTHAAPGSAHDLIAGGVDRSWSFLRPRGEGWRAAVQRAAERAGCVELLPMRAASLSEGQKQRVLVARALASNPDLLVLDEPTSAMDSDAQSATFEMLAGLAAEGVAIVMVTHHVAAAAQWATHTMVLQRGETPAIGTLAAVSADPSIRAAFPALGGAA